MPDAVTTDLEVGCYVYGVVPAQGERPSLTGLDEHEVEYVEHEEIAAAVGRIVLDRPPGRRADLLAHSHVVDCLAEAGPVIPVQFGSVLADEESVVADVLAADHDHFVALLEEVRGKVQLNLRATYQRDQVLSEVVQSHPEIAELRRRTKDLPEGTMHPDLVRLGELVARVMEARRVEDAQDVLEVVRPLVVGEAPRTGGGLDHVVSIALLVESEGVAELEERLEELAEAVHERIRLQLSGPVAPYDFVGGQAWA